jgi:4-hydroxy-4-methyl-2-oxoglutarate aldolase
MKMPEKISEKLGAFPTGNLCNAHPEVRAMGPGITPLFSGAKVCGPAKTARIKPGQNAAIHLAVHTACPGDVLVIEADGNTDFGPFGDILATNCRNKKIVGLIIDGTIRDTGEICEMGFPVFCRGANPTATEKTDPGEIDISITCAGLVVKPGDFVVGDDDGVVVIPASLVEIVAENAAKVAQKEKVILARLASGETTKEIFEL